MFIVLKKEKIISCIITICIVAGLFTFANITKFNANAIQASTKTNETMIKEHCTCNNCENCENNCNCYMTNTNNNTNIF